MRIIYTRHARQRTRQRKISQEQVEETLEVPDDILPGDNGEEIAIKRYENREMRVVYEDTVVIYTVIKPRISRKKSGV